MMEQACLIEKIEKHIESIEHVVSSDPAMVAKVIKLANSSFYRHTERHVGIQQSLRTIGLDMVKCIALSMAVMETFGNETPSMKELWKHSYAVAFISGMLGCSKPEKECLFTGGLLHDIGRMVLICKAPDQYLPMCEFSGNWPDLILERDVFSLDHTIIGEMIALRWHFPPEVISVIRHHHEPVCRMSALVYLTDKVTQEKEEQQPAEDLKDGASIKGYLGAEYKDLVNTIRQRYRTNKAIFENLG